MSFRRWLAFQFSYFGRPRWDTGISPPELLAFLQANPPGRALDLGCGTGTNVITLARHGWQVTGVDFAWRAIRVAQKKARQAQVQADFRVGDVTHLEEIAGPFDLILDIGCYHSLTDAGRRGYRETLGRLLAPGGSFLLYTFFRSSPEAPPPGVVEEDLAPLAAQYHLAERLDSTERGIRPAVWLTYRRNQGR